MRARCLPPLTSSRAYSKLNLYLFNDIYVTAFVAGPRLLLHKLVTYRECMCSARAHNAEPVCAVLCSAVCMSVVVNSCAGYSMDASANASIGADRNAFAFVISGDESSQTFIVHTEDERYNWMLEVASQLTQRDAPVALPNGMKLRPRSSFITSQTVAAALAAGPAPSRTTSMDAQAFDSALSSAAAAATIQSARRGVVSMSGIPLSVTTIPSSRVRDQFSFCDVWSLLVYVPVCRATCCIVVVF